MLLSEKMGKLLYPEKNLLEQGREPITNSTHISRKVRESNPGGSTLVEGECSHHCAIPAPLWYMYTWIEKSDEEKSLVVYANKTIDRSPTSCPLNPYRLHCSVVANLNMLYSYNILIHRCARRDSQSLVWSVVWLDC